MFFFNKKRKSHSSEEFNPDEIFVDSLNPSGLNTQQMEGVIEKPLSLFSLRFLKFLIFAVFIIFLGKSFSLQVMNGKYFQRLANENLLRRIPLFAERGIIYDRNGVELAWNESRDDISEFSKRYYKGEAFGQLLGYVRYPQKDSKGNYWSFQTVGEYGIEKKYNEILSGKNGSQLVEYGANGKRISENLIFPAESGENVKVTIDANLQETLYESLREYVSAHHFKGAGAAIMDVRNGDLLALVSYPSFDSNVMTNERKSIKQYLKSSQKPFFNRVVSGLYPPGSTVKPFIALAALTEGIIDRNTKILSTGKIEVKNPYNPSRPSIYRDWKKGGHGLTDVRKAIAESVNTFFYAIGGGYGSQKGLGIRKIDEYLKRFRVGERVEFSLFPEKDGVIPSPEWKEKTFHDPWRLGDTYISSIGQFGFLVSPLQTLRSFSAIANKSFFVQPHILIGQQVEREPLQGIKEKDLNLVREGMRDVVRKGTAQNLLIDGVSIAAKSGTAQVGVHNEYYDSWIVGFLPYKKPRYVFVLLLEKGQKEYGGSASSAFRNFLLRFKEEYPESFSEYFADK